MITNKNITHQAVGWGQLGWMACQACDIYKMNCRPYTEEIVCVYTLCDAGSPPVSHMTNLISELWTDAPAEIR